MGSLVRSHRTQCDNNIRVDYFELLLKKTDARFLFVWFWIAVVRRPAFEDIAYENIFAIQPHGFDDIC